MRKSRSVSMNVPKGTNSLTPSLTLYMRVYSLNDEYTSYKTNYHADIHNSRSHFYGLVLPIFINGRIKKKHDRKALIMLCRILAIAFIALAIYRELFI